MAFSGRLSDAPWAGIPPHLPRRGRNPHGGRPPAEPRTCFEGILWTGAPCKALPRPYGKLCPRERAPGPRIVAASVAIYARAVDASFVVPRGWLALWLAAGVATFWHAAALGQPSALHDLPTRSLHSAIYDPPR